MQVIVGTCCRAAVNKQPDPPTSSAARSKLSTASRYTLLMPTCAASCLRTAAWSRVNSCRCCCCHGVRACCCCCGMRGRLEEEDPAAAAAAVSSLSVGSKADTTRCPGSPNILLLAALRRCWMPAGRVQGKSQGHVPVQCGQSSELPGWRGAGGSGGWGQKHPPAVCTRHWASPPITKQPHSSHLRCSVELGCCRWRCLDNIWPLLFCCWAGTWWLFRVAVPACG